MTTDGLPAHLRELTPLQRALTREMWKRMLEEVEALDAEDAEAGITPQPAFVALKGSHQASTVECQHKLPVTDHSYLTEGVRVASTYTDYFWLTLGVEHPDTLIGRFLRARKWDVEKAVEMMVNSVKWRKEFGTLEVLREGEACLDLDELQINKVYFNDVDRESRPVANIHVRLHNKNKVILELTKRLTISLLETGRLVIRPPAIAATLVFDMTNFGLINMDYNFISFLVSTMEAHYPESLGAALILNAPWIFNGCWTIIRPWLDPVVASKVHFIQTKDLQSFLKKENINKALDENTYTSDFVFQWTPATSQDNAVEEKIRNDKAGQDKARAEYKAAWAEFDTINRKWAEITEENVPAELEIQREQASRKMREKFAALDVYIRGRTYYHRTNYVLEAPDVLKEIP